MLRQGSTYLLNLSKYKILFLLGFILFFTSPEILAQARGGAGGAPRFSIGLYGLAGQGKMGNGQTDAIERDMFHTVGGLFLGFNWRRIRFGANYDYALIGQTTEPGTVGDTNLSGKSTAPGVRLEYYDGKTSVGFVYRLSDEYKLDRNSFLGAESIYKGSGGYTVQISRQMKGSLGILLDYSAQEYKESLPSGNVKWTRIGLGIVISNFRGK